MKIHRNEEKKIKHSMSSGNIPKIYFLIFIRSLGVWF